MDQIERVEKWAGKGSGAAPRPDAAVPGFDVFLVQLPSKGRTADFYTGAAVATGSKKVVPGEEALRDALARWRPAAPELAKAVSVLVDRGAEVLLDPPAGIDVNMTAEQERSLVRPPTLEGGTLTYWSFRRPGQAPGLVQSRIDLATLQVQHTAAQSLLRAAVPEADRLPSLLAGTNPSEEEAAFEILQEHCDDPAMRPVVEAALTSTSVAAEVRARLVELVEGCRALAGIDALGAVLAKDGDASVRLAAVGPLARSLDPAALPYLDRAATGDLDPSVRASAQMGAEGLRRRIP